MWTIRIDGNPTVTCKNEMSALHSYETARRWEQSGHIVEMWQGRNRVLPSLPSKGV